MGLFIEFLTEQWLYTGLIALCFFFLMHRESRKSGAKLSPQQLVAMVNQQQAVVVDVREAAEFGKGHIVDAINIPSKKLADRSGELDAYQSRPIVLVCRLGHDSGAAGKLLAAKGFQVFRLGGGMAEWLTMQLPLVKA